MIYIISTNLAKFRSNFIKISAKKDEINGNFGKKSEIFRNLGAEFLRNFEFGAVQKCVHLVDLFKSFQTSIYFHYLLAKIGVDTAENETSLSKFAKH